MGKKKSKTVAPVITPTPAPIVTPKQKKPQYITKTVDAPKVDYAARQQEQIDANNKMIADQKAANEQARRDALMGQSRDIVNSNIKNSATRARTMGTRSREATKSEYNSLVSKEFGRLMKLDSGQAVEDLDVGINKRKYEGFKKGRGNFGENLSSKDLLG